MSGNPGPSPEKIKPLPPWLVVSLLLLGHVVFTILIVSGANSSPSKFLQKEPSPAHAETS